MCLIVMAVTACGWCGIFVTIFSASFESTLTPTYSASRSHALRLSYSVFSTFEKITPYSLCKHPFVFFPVQCNFMYPALYYVVIPEGGFIRRNQIVIHLVVKGLIAITASLMSI